MPSKTATLLLTLPLIAILQGGARPTAAAAAAPESTASGQINFLSIVVDEETAAADTRLRKVLEKAAADSSPTGSAHRTVRFQQQTMPYGDVIRAFAEPDPGRGYLARITPYAYVAAELLGAIRTILRGEIYVSGAMAGRLPRELYVHGLGDYLSAKSAVVPDSRTGGF